MASSFPKFRGPDENWKKYLKLPPPGDSKWPFHNRLFFIKSRSFLSADQVANAGPQFFPSAMLENFGKKNGWNQQRKPEKKKDTQNFTELKPPQKKKTFPIVPSLPWHVTIQGIKAHTQNSFIELLPKNTVALAAGSQILDTWWDTDLPYPAVQSTRKQYSICFFFKLAIDSCTPAK